MVVVTVRAVNACSRERTQQQYSSSTGAVLVVAEGGLCNCALMVVQMIVDRYSCQSFSAPKGGSGRDDPLPQRKSVLQSAAAAVDNVPKLPDRH
jgi:hypothetical protein